MAWTAPRTWISAEVVTASIMNTHVRDNFLETAPGVATAALGFIVSNGLNSVIQRGAGIAELDALETTTSTSFTDLATTGPTVTAATSNRALLLWGARMWNDTAGQEVWVGVNVTGASSLSPVVSFATQHQSDSGSQENTHYLAATMTGLTVGSNTFTLQYKVSANTGSFQYRKLTVFPAF